MTKQVWKVQEGIFFHDYCFFGCRNTLVLIHDLWCRDSIITAAWHRRQIQTHSAPVISPQTRCPPRSNMCHLYAAVSLTERHLETLISWSHPCSVIPKQVFLHIHKHAQTQPQFNSVFILKHWCICKLSQIYLYTFTTCSQSHRLCFCCSCRHYHWPSVEELWTMTWHSFTDLSLSLALVSSEIELCCKITNFSNLWVFLCVCACGSWHLPRGELG